MFGLLLFVTQSRYVISRRVLMAILIGVLAVGIATGIAIDAWIVPRL